MAGKPSPAEQELLEGAYRDFNARRLDAVLARMQPSVVWPNGMEGGYVLGHAGVRDYWTRQWAVFSPKVDPIEFDVDPFGRLVLRVHQVVHDHDGNLLLDTIVHHIYTLRDGLIERMEIEKDPPRPEN
jgi:hypothetical protein